MRMRKFGTAFLRLCRDLLADPTVGFALILAIVIAAGRGIVGEPAVFHAAPAVALAATLLPRLIRRERRRRGGA